MLLKTGKGFIAGLVEWSTKKRTTDKKRMAGIVSRNYRTWIGHSTVTTFAVAAGKIIALVLGAPALVVMTLVANGFYLNREFGLKGNYYEAKDMDDSREAQDKRIDSLGDFIVPLVASVFSVFNFTMLGSGIAFAVLLGSMIILKRLNK